MELRIEHTKVLTDILNNKDKRIILLQGGSRSSKTYSVLQYLILIALTNPNSTIGICRNSLPTIRGTILKDFIDILINLNLYNEKQFNKTNLIYEFNNKSTINFFSAEDEQKLRGRKNNYVYINEGNEIDFKQFNQISLRTSEQILIDYNPSDTESYLYDLKNQDNTILLKSTYKDNIFLGKEQIKYIENLINVDENYYKIYALGEPPIPSTRIYSHFKTYLNLPDNNLEYVYGLDFGFNHPTALIKAYELDDTYYIEEIIYQKNLTTTDLLTLMQEYDVKKHIPIYCDPARPEIIEEIKRSGYNTKLADKQVKSGIDYIKSKQIFINKNSINILEEAKKYMWKTYKNNIIDEPIKLYDDAMDAIRYALYSNKKKNNNITFFNTRELYDEDYLGNNFL